jgi:hypothetical protein
VGTWQQQLPRLPASVVEKFLIGRLIGLPKILNPRKKSFSLNFFPLPQHQNNLLLPPSPQATTFPDSFARVQVASRNCECGQCIVERFLLSCLALITPHIPALGRSRLEGEEDVRGWIVPSALRIVNIPGRPTFPAAPILQGKSSQLLFLFLFPLSPSNDDNFYHVFFSHLIRP